jgi:hypothetical protein
MLILMSCFSENDDPIYEDYLDEISGALSGNIFFLCTGFIWSKDELWGEQDKTPTARQQARIQLTERSGWSEKRPVFGIPDFLSFFATSFSLYVLVEGWLFVPEAIDNRGLTITAMASAIFFVSIDMYSLFQSLCRVESESMAFSAFTILLAVGDFIGMFVTSLNMSDLLTAYPSTSVNRVLVFLCCLLAFFRAITALLFSCYNGANYDAGQGNVDLINATVGNFAWPLIIKLFPLQLKGYTSLLNHSGSSVLPAVIRSSSFLRMLLLIYLNGVSLATSDSIAFHRIAVVSVICATFDFISASYMWLFWGLWDQIQQANPQEGSLNQPLLSAELNIASNGSNLIDLQDPHTYLLYLKNWWSFYIMSLMDLASLAVSIVNIQDIILLFDGNLRWLVGVLFALFLLRAFVQFCLGVKSIIRIRNLTTQHSSLENWRNFLPPTNPRETLKLEFMYLSDCSFNSFVGFLTMLCCPAALTRFLLHGFQSIDKRKPKAKSIGVVNLITVIKSVINVVVCFIAFVNLQLPLVQVVILTASLILSLWRGILSLSGFLLHTTVANQIPLKISCLLWTASFSTIASILACIVSQPCIFAPKLCQADASQCLGQICAPAAICHARSGYGYSCTCPPWLTGNGTGSCHCPYSYFSLPTFDRETCVNAQVFMSLGDMTSVLSAALCLLFTSLVGFYEWKHLKEKLFSFNFKVSIGLAVFSFVIVGASLGTFSGRHPLSSNCPSWMISSGASCMCPLSDYPVPDFERGVCVTSKSHMSQGQVAGVAVGALASTFVLFFLLNKSKNWLSNWCPSVESRSQIAYLGFSAVLITALLFGLVFGLGSSKFFPVPKTACGFSDGSYSLCDLNAQCVDGACVCDSGLIGDGVTCAAGLKGSCIATSNACDVKASCTSIPSGGYSCSCPSWMSGSGYKSSPCSCPLSDYPVPDFERGVCVTSKSHMSQGQVAGVAVGVLVCFLVPFLFCRCEDNGWGYRLICYVAYGLIFGLVFGLGSSKFFPVPKTACGFSDGSYSLCDLNAQCVDGACVCDSGLIGDGVTCAAGLKGSCIATSNACDVKASCTSIPSGGYSCSCPSWMSGSGYKSSPCSCPLSDYPVPDFERGVCVTSKSHMSQGQVAGVAVGVAFCGGILLLYFCASLFDRSVCAYFLGFLLFFGPLFGLVFGLGSSKYFPVPKAACGNSSASFKLCDFNAECIDSTCVCNAGFIGDGVHEYGVVCIRNPSGEAMP